MNWGMRRRVRREYWRGFYAWIGYRPSLLPRPFDSQFHDMVDTLREHYNRRFGYLWRT